MKDHLNTDCGYNFIVAHFMRDIHNDITEKHIVFELIMSITGCPVSLVQNIWDKIIEGNDETSS